MAIKPATLKVTIARELLFRKLAVAFRHDMNEKITKKSNKKTINTAEKANDKSVVIIIMFLLLGGYY